MVAERAVSVCLGPASAWSDAASGRRTGSVRINYFFADRVMEPAAFPILDEKHPQGEQHSGIKFGVTNNNLETWPALPV